MADEERLVFALEARIRDFEKNFAKAHATANKRLTAIEKRAEQSAANMKAAFAGAGNAINTGLSTLGVGGFALGGGAAGAVAAVRSVAASISEMSAEAKKAGIAVEPFQELSYAAQQARVSADALTDGLKEMQLRAEEFVFTGKGSGAEAFQRLGYSAEQLKEKLKDPSALFEEIIDRLKQFDTAAQIRISDEVFGGTGGEQFVRFLEQGRKSIAESRAEARELGTVMDSDMVKKAEDLDAKFNQLSLTIETRLKGGIVNVAAAFDSWAASVQSFLTKVGNWDGWAKLSSGYAPPAGVTKIDQNDPWSVARAKLAAGLAAGQKSNVPTGTSEDWVWKPDPNAGKPKPAASNASAQNTYGYEDLHTTSQQRLTDLQTEQAALGMTTERAAAYRFEQEALAQAKEHDITLTPQQTEELKQLAAQYGKVSAAIEQTHASQQKMQEMQQELGNLASSSITGLIDGTKSLNDVLADSLNLLAQMLLKSALLGEGALGNGGGGLIGAVTKGLTGMLGGGTSFYATGGYTGTGGKYDPAGVVHRGEVVWSQDDIRRAGGVAVVEAMRRGAKGYANGGAVAVPTTMRIPSTSRGLSGAASQATKSRPQNINLNMAFDVKGAMGRGEITQQIQDGMQAAVLIMRQQVPGLALKGLADDQIRRR